MSALALRRDTPEVDGPEIRGAPQPDGDRDPNANAPDAQPPSTLQGMGPQDDFEPQGGGDAAMQPASPCARSSLAAPRHVTLQLPPSSLKRRSTPVVATSGRAAQAPKLVKSGPIVSLPRLERIKTLAQVLSVAGPQTWLRVDKEGSTSELATDKFSVAMALGIQPRDLRLLDPRMSALTPPAILGRERAIVVNLAGVKCIITQEYVLVADPVGNIAKTLLQDLQQKLSDVTHKGHVMSYPGLSRISEMTQRHQHQHQHLHQHQHQHQHQHSISLSLPGTGTSPSTGAEAGQGMFITPSMMPGLSFELKVLEICLDLAVYTLTSEAHELETFITPALERLTRKVEMRQLEAVRRAKNRLTALMQRINQIEEVFERVLEDEQGMWRLNLSAHNMTRQGTRSLRGDQEDVLASTLARSSYRSTRSTRSGRSGRTAGTSNSSSTSSSASSRRSLMSMMHEAEVAEVEMLLEAYHTALSTCAHKMQTLEQFVEDAEGLVGTSLDEQRNRIIAVNLVLTSIFTTLAVINVETGLFGISVPFNDIIDQHSYTNWLLVVCVGCVAIPFGLLLLFLLSLKRQNLVSFS